jgi:hypothetical protein
MAGTDERDQEPHHPVVLAKLLTDDERDRSGRLARALDRSPDRHRALIRLVAGVLVAAVVYGVWRLVS